VSRLEVRTGAASYPVLIEAGLIDRAGEVLEPLTGAREKVALIADASVSALHGERLRAALAPLGAVATFDVEPGEASKSRATAGALWEWMAEAGLHRGDLVVSFGGGVTSDLAGFAAATFHRGVDVVHVPTTVLGQVDAAIGGKTGIDLPAGKNLVGSFHHPRAVLSDVDVLATLPDAAFRTGMAEVIKHGLIAAGALLDRVVAARDALLARERGTLEEIVTEAARVKVAIVERDEREAGERAFLNYGHTLGHALEAHAAYAGRTHGEAVAVGMMFAAHLAREAGLGDRVELHRAALETYGLPTTGAGASFDDLLAIMARDKKYDRGLRFVLLEDLGRPVLRGDLGEQALRAAYDAIR